jgi:hypothetical protein
MITIALGAVLGLIIFSFLPELLALVGYFLVAVLGVALVIGGGAVVGAVVQNPGGAGLFVLTLGGWCLIMYLIGLIWIQGSKWGNYLLDKLVEILPPRSSKCS